jgi:sulfur-oxidizing protein SoxX
MSTTLPSLLTTLYIAFCACTGAAAQHGDDAAAGREIAHDPYLGNCLACHRIPGDAKAVTLATIGPPIVDMRARFPDRAELRTQIWDPTLRNPNTVMPPFGKHGVLTERQIDLVLDYIYRY